MLYENQYGDLLALFTSYGCTSGSMFATKISRFIIFQNYLHKEIDLKCMHVLFDKYSPSAISNELNKLS